MYIDYDDIMEMIEDTTDQWGNRYFRYLNHDGMLIEISQYSDGSTGYASSEYRGY